MAQLIESDPEAHRILNDFETELCRSMVLLNPLIKYLGMKSLNSEQKNDLTHLTTTLRAYNQKQGEKLFGEKSAEEINECIGNLRLDTISKTTKSGKVTKKTPKKLTPQEITQLFIKGGDDTTQLENLIRYVNSKTKLPGVSNDLSNIAMISGEHLRFKVYDTAEKLQHPNIISAKFHKMEVHLSTPFDIIGHFNIDLTFKQPYTHGVIKSLLSRLGITEEFESDNFFDLNKRAYRGKMDKVTVRKEYKIES